MALMLDKLDKYNRVYVNSKEYDLYEGKGCRIDSNLPKLFGKCAEM